MTLTYPALARARQILWLVTGSDKKEPLAKLLAGDTTIPAGGVEAGGVAGDGRPRGDLRPGCRDRDAPAGQDTTRSKSVRSTDSPRPTRTVATMSGGNSPCSTTPGVAANRAARAAGSPTGPW